MQKTAFYNESPWKIQGFERNQELHQENIVSLKTQFHIDWEVKAKYLRQSGRNSVSKKRKKNSCWWGGGLCYIQMVEERKTQ